MTIYTVHAPAGRDRSAEAAESVRFVKEGFAWPALFIPFVWLLWHRMWLPLLGYVLALGVIQGIDFVAGETIATVVAIAFSLWFALEANAMRRWVLERRGLPLVAVVEGSGRESAERRFFDGWFHDQAASDAPPPPAGRAVPSVRATPSGVIGLFPDREGR
ncbi:DUF2628 domain-containing protein [Chthonobacter albigriseus]|uniref:DUF2628 domain-containing protein n=1 Tax=Chthonobacter albigriseus TaxID=1683161 RepID=UPI0015EF144C|nr:DUF2628 domain-containing protein [Chthonobacter albigriseus]